MPEIGREEPPIVSPDELRSIANAATEEIEATRTLERLDELRVRYLGKKSAIAVLSGTLGRIDPKLRPMLGQAVSAAKKQIESTLEARRAALDATTPRVQRGIDVTLPGVRRGNGRRHPIMQIMEELLTALQGLGFQHDDYPEVETEFFNFDALNMPASHPARDMHDTFFTRSGFVLRTHTSAFQVRAMRRYQSPPIRAMTCGRCYRNDKPDDTHSPFFHQLDVISIGRGTNFSDLKWTLEKMLRVILGDQIRLRFRPSYFPFTTPSAEVDVEYRGKWMELLGSGMIRPEVLRAGGIAPEHFQGFAFGMGIDRLAMARYGIDDIRLMYSNEEAFLSQF